MDRPAEIPGAVIAGTYRLVRPLDGGAGRVHEARHDRLVGRFAVKLFSATEPQAFQRSAQLASALRHPGIVQVIDYSATQGEAFVVMEYIDGQPLSAIIAETGLMPADRVARLIDSVAAGLSAAHAQGLAHGHLSPERVFVLAGGERKEKTREATKIVGFGLGEEVSLNPELTEVTPYTAPEQVSGGADPRTDQFALAAIAYEMLTGVPPFDDSTQRQEPPSIRDYAPEVNVIVDDVIRRALAPEPEDRWPDVTIFAQRLKEAGDSGSLEEKTRVTMSPFAQAPAQMTPTPVDGVEELTPGPTPPPPPLVTSVEINLGATPPPASVAGTLEGRRITPFGAPLLLPPPTQPRAGFTIPGLSAGPVVWQAGRTSSGPRLPPPNLAPARAPWATPPPVLGFSGHVNGGRLSGTMTVPRIKRRRGGGRALLLTITAAAMAFIVVKLDAWQYAQPLLARFGLHLGGSSDAVATSAGGSAAAPSPSAAIAGSAPGLEAPAGKPGSTQAPLAAAETHPAADPPPPAAAHAQVVQLPAAVTPTPPPAPAPHHAARRARKSAALPPDLAAAEEALLKGDDPPAAAKPAAKVADADADADDAPRTPAASACTITISSKPWSEVWLDGKNTGRRTPLRAFPVSCGDHQLALKREDLDLYQMEVITVRAGLPLKKSYPLE